MTPSSTGLGIAEMWVVLYRTGPRRIDLPGLAYSVPVCRHGQKGHRREERELSAERCAGGPPWAGGPIIGLFGYLSGFLFPALQAIAVCAAAAGLDEALQWALRWRVGDWRDVLFNGAGALAGVTLARGQRRAGDRRRRHLPRLAALRLAAAHAAG